MTNSRFKFRVWDNENKKFISRHTAVYLDVEGVVMASGGGIENKYMQQVSGFEVTQSTGLYDCDGKEIWEGDMIDYQSFGKYLIEFYSGAFRTECMENTALESFMFNSELLIESANENNVCHYAKVIGNRFESPEFLTN